MMSSSRRIRKMMSSTATTAAVVNKTIASVLDATANRIPDQIAVVSATPESLMGTLTASTPPSPLLQPFSRYSYHDIREKTNRVAGFLKAYGYEHQDVLISDLPNVAENLILQIACNRIGVTYATMKNREGMTKLEKVKGAVSATGTGFLAETTMSLPSLTGDYLLDLMHGLSGSKNHTLFGLEDFKLEENEQQESASSSLSPPHAYYNNTKPFTNDEAIQMGTDAAWEVAMIEDDVVCVAITLCHPFGMGSGVLSTFSTGATLVLPSVGGIRGCGVPSERAEATLNVLESEQCTLLFADTHTLQAFPSSSSSSSSSNDDDDNEVDPLRTNTKLNLKGGICKVGSGSEILDETIQCGGATLKTIGTREKV